MQDISFFLSASLCVLTVRFASAVDVRSAPAAAFDVHVDMGVGIIERAGNGWVPYVCAAETDSVSRIEINNLQSSGIECVETGAAG